MDLRRFDLITLGLLIINTLFALYNIHLNGLDNFINGTIGYEGMMQAGAMDSNSSTLSWWTAMFTHFSLSHYAMNMFSLVSIGILTRNFYGHILYLIGYLGSGMITSICTHILSDDLTVSAGASGAIMGILGMCLIASLLTRDVNMTGFFGSILFVVMFQVFMTFVTPDVSIIGHISGLIGGVIIGVILMILKNSISKIKERYYDGYK